MGKLLAHLTDINGERKEQTLTDHCEKTAQYASECLRNAGFYHTAFLAGILHDMGKATHVFNDYLERAFAGEKVVRGSVNHTFAGVIFLLEKYHNDPEKQMDCLTGEILAYAIGAHHGLFDCVDLNGDNGFLHRLQKNREEICYDEARENYFSQVISEEKIDEYFQKSRKEIETFFKRTRVLDAKNGFLFQIGMLSRLILSGVIYGDRRDTREFMSQSFDSEMPQTDWSRMRAYMEQKLSEFDMSSPINRVRGDISEQCLRFAARPAGIYRLSVPTGAGKTLCTLRYALAHAERYKKKRIIFIIPLLSVLDQNAGVIRDYLEDAGLLLEHHSNVLHEPEKQSGGAEQLDPYELLTESWNAPVIISTLVQFLNMLFKHQTAAIGRMRALCDSVVVIDEVQSLPQKIAAMFSMAMNFLSQYCNTTILLSSATQPCFEELKWSMHLADKPDMVTLNQEQLKVFHRSDIIDKTDQYGMDIPECADFCDSLMDRHASLLVICNTKKEARELYDRLREKENSADCKVFHLSTSMCQKHRENTLNFILEELVEIQQGIRDGKRISKIICVATQLVEAGIDFSFDGVVRIMAGIDNLAQAAGRCNRSNEYPYAGKVYLVNLKNENLRMLPDIASAQICTRKVLELKRTDEEKDLTGEYFTGKYYSYLFHEAEKQVNYPVKDCGEVLYLAELLANKNKYAKIKEENRNYIFQQPFRTVGKLFEVFENQTIDVLVPYGQGEKLIKQLDVWNHSRMDFDMLRDFLRRVKPYTISIYQWQKDQLDEFGLLRPFFDGRVQVLLPDAYDERYGLGEIREKSTDYYFV